MAYMNLPCGCMMQWDEEETTVVFCNRHIVHYFDWGGTDRDFVKMIVTPKNGKTDRRLLLEMR
jgi:hypothetical protein